MTAAVAGLGHNFIALDPDGPARRFPPFVRQGDRYMPLLGVAAALAGGSFRPEEVVLEGDSIRVRDRSIPLVPVKVVDVKDPARTHDQQTMLINYRAPALVNGKRPYPSYDAAMLLKSQSQLEVGEKPDIPPDVFKDKIVFVGIAFSGLVDVFQTPFGAGSMIGIQLHASVADSILSNRFLRPARAWTAVAATVGAALVIGLMSATLPFWVAAAIAAAVVAGWTGAALYAFDRGLWLVMAQPILASAVALFAGTAYRYFVEDAEKRKVSRLFGRYVSRDVYKQLMAHPELAELGGGRREMSVLFSDLRGFTSITEKGNPEDLVEQLNEYFTRMVEIVFRNGGTVDKFVGDMVMALFGAPVDDVDHADDAVTTAVEMVRELGELNRRWASRGARPARHRHRREFGRHDCRKHRFLGDHELHGDRRQRQPGRQARVAEQGLQDPHYHQRGHARPAGEELRVAPPGGRRGQGEDAAGRDFRSDRAVAARGEPRGERRAGGGRRGT